MNVKELIDHLRTYPDNTEVLFVYNYGDYWKTDVAGTIDNVEEGEVTYSEYHRMDKVVDYDAEDELDDEVRANNRLQNRPVVLLR
jgi:hypothetical protein